MHTDRCSGLHLRGEVYYPAVPYPLYPIVLAWLYPTPGYIPPPRKALVQRYPTLEWTWYQQEVQANGF